MNWTSVVNNDLQSTLQKKLQRRLSAINQESVLEISSPSAPSETPRKRLLFSSNDYLGLSGHVDVQLAARKAVMSPSGMGSRAAPTVCGFTDYHAELCALLANMKGKENCVLFPTGFSANLAVLQSLTSAVLELSANVIIFSDELNHASIVDGCRLSKQIGKESVKVIVYPHQKVEFIVEKLHLLKSERFLSIVVSDSLFSMDGDFCSLHEFAKLKQMYGDSLLVILDEAHETLVTGDGDGRDTHQLNYDFVDCRVGTLSKAVGTLGGFVCSTQIICDLLVNRARSMKFSTALPTPIVAAAIASIKVGLSPEGVSLRRKLWQLITIFVEGLKPEYRPSKQNRSPIIPIILNDEDKALQISHKLALKGFIIPAIRPPTVPKGTSRLRITLSAIHTKEQVLMLLKCLHTLGIANDTLLSRL